MQLLTLDQKQNKRTDVTRISSSLIVRCITARHVPLSLFVDFFLCICPRSLPPVSHYYSFPPLIKILPTAPAPYPSLSQLSTSASRAVEEGPRALPPGAAPVPAPTSCTHERPLMTSDERQSPHSAREKHRELTREELTSTFPLCM